MDCILVISVSASSKDELPCLRVNERSSTHCQGESFSSNFSVLLRLPISMSANQIFKTTPFSNESIKSQIVARVCVIGRGYNPSSVIYGHFVSAAQIIDKNLSFFWFLIRWWRKYLSILISVGSTVRREHPGMGQFFSFMQNNDVL